MDQQKLQQSLIAHEGLRNKPYEDSIGKLTIGVGRNLTDVGISNDEAIYLLGNDIKTAYAEAILEPWWSSVSDNDARSRAMVEMVFNMGLGILRGFVHALFALSNRDYETAANEFMQSHWAEQVGQRAKVLTEMIRTGSD